MAGEQHGGAGAAVVVGEEVPHPRLGIYIQTQGGLIEKQNRRLVQQGRQQFGLHPLAQGKLAHRAPQLLAQLQHLGELANAALRLRLRNAVDRGIHP